MNLPLTGINHIDKDHIAIIDMLDDVFKQLSDPFSDFNEPLYTDTMLHILDYCSRHCKEEEESMKGMDYPEISIHHEKHLEMMQEIKENLRLTMEKKLSRKDNILKCRTIVIDHINFQDAPFFKFCKEVQK